MRYILVILAALFIASCTKTEAPYIFSYDDVIGKTYISEPSSLEFLSEDTLVWKILYYRDSATFYKVKYQIVDNDIHFELNDTVREDYIDPILDKPWFIKTYYSATFNGTFKNRNTIHNCKESHGYSKYPDDLYLSAAGSLNITVTYHSND